MIQYVNHEIFINIYELSLLVDVYASVSAKYWPSAYFGLIGYSCIFVKALCAILYVNFITKTI